MQSQPNGHLQDEDFSSWLSYPVDDYCSEILSQLAGEEEMKNSEEELSKPVVNFSIFSRAIMESTSKNHEAGPGSSSMCSKNEPRVRCREENEEDRAEVQEEGESLERRPPKRQALDKKRTRTSQIHNMSERRRRDRINEKMRALQELVPSCNKADKASMLDKVIEYLKTLQMQVQVMSMGFMHPMMLQSGIPMNMGIGMGMVDVSRIPTSSFPSVNGINGNHPGIPMMMQGTTMSSPVMPIPMMYSSHFMATRLAQTSSETTMVSLDDSLHSSEMCSKKSRADACKNV